MSRSSFDIELHRDPPPSSECDYEIPREVADALRDVMDEVELRDAFFGDSLAGALRGYEDVTTR